MPIGNPFDIGGGGVTQSQLDAIRPDNVVYVKSESDLPAPVFDASLGFDVIQLEDKDYIGAKGGDSIITISYPMILVEYDPLSEKLLLSKFTGNVLWKYIGSTGAMFVDSAGSLPSALLLIQTAIGSNGTNQLFDLKNSIGGIGILNSILQNFGPLGILRNHTAVILNQLRLNGFTDTLKLIENGQVRISQSIDTTSTLGGKPYYEISGTTPIVNIGGNPQVIFQNPNDTFLKIDTFLKFKTINIEGVGLDNAAGGASTGRLFTAGLSGSGTASDNGSGNVRVNSALHGLSDQESIWLQGFNPYRTRGYKIKLIDTNNFDLLGDCGDILSFADAGGGLINVTTDLKHRLINGNAVVIASVTYTGIYTVSGVSPLTPNLFQITETFAGTDTGTYEHYEPFTTAGDNLNWYSGSLNETTPGLSSLNNGKETDSNVEIVVEFTDAGPTALNSTTWTPIAVTATLQPNGEQRFEVASDGKIYYTGKRQVVVTVNTALYGQLSTGTETDVQFTYLVNTETTPRASTLIDGTTWKNVNRGKNVISLLTINEGDYINPPAAKLLAGTSNITIQPSRCFVKR